MMNKKVFFVSAFTAILLLSACGDSEGEDRLAIQQMLDDGDYTGVISKLEGSVSSDDDYIALGAAYMGKAGVSLSNIVNAMASTDNTNDDGFATFVKSIADISTPTAITDLGKSADYYKEVVGDCSGLNLSNSSKDICLYIGLGATARTAVTIESLVGDITTFTDSSVADDKLSASVCAMQYALDGSTGTDCSIREDTDVYFTTIDKTYTPLIVTVNVTDYYYLMTTTTPKKTVLTDGYCSATDFTTRTQNYDAINAPYACPINEDPTVEELTTTDVLVNVLNDGIEAVGAAVTEDIQADIDEFKCDIVGGIYVDGSGCTQAIDSDINEQDIINYLDTQN